MEADRTAPWVSDFAGMHQVSFRRTAHRHPRTSFHAPLDSRSGAELLHAVLAAIAGPVRRAGLSSGRARAAPGQDSAARGLADTAAAPDSAGACPLTLPARASLSGRAKLRVSGYTFWARECMRNRDLLYLWEHILFLESEPTSDPILSWGPLC